MKTTKPRLAVPALLLGALLVIGGPAAPASAQVPIPELPSLEEVGLAELLSTVTGAIYGLLGSPAWEVSFDGDAEMFGSAAMSIAGDYTCSGLFLPVTGLDGPRKLEIYITQAFDEDEPGSAITKGYRQRSTLICDGAPHEFNAIVTADYGQFAFQEGIAVVEVVITVCDLRGCQRGSVVGGVDASF